MLIYLTKVKFDISAGNGPVRLFEKRMIVMSLSRSPISGGTVPKSGTLEILRAITRELLSHVTPVNLQCADDDELATQSQSPELLGPIIEAFRFNKARKSDDEFAFEHGNSR